MSLLSKAPDRASRALRGDRRRILRPLGLGLATSGVLASLLLLIDPGVATRWLRRAPSLRIDLPDTQATPLKPDPGASILPEDAALSIEVMELEAPRDRLRHLVSVPDARGRPRWIVAGGAGGLTVIDLSQVSAPEGCLELPRARVRTLDTRDGLPGLRIEALLLGGSPERPRLWVGTRGGLAELRVRPEQGLFVARTFVAGLSSPRVSALALDRGRLIVATHDGGLHRLEADRLRPIRAPGRRGRSIAALLSLSATHDRPARVIFAGRRGVGRLWGAAGQVRWFDHRWITHLGKTREGRVLAGGPDGLFAIRGETLQPLIAEAGPVTRLLGTGCDPRGCDRILPVGLDGRALLSPAGAPMVRDRARLSVEILSREGLPVRLRFAATDAGLVFEDPAGHDHLLRLGGLGDADVSALEVGGGALWVGTYDAGLWRLGDGATRRIAKEITRVDALVEAPEYGDGGNGGVLVATPEGVFSVSADGSRVIRHGLASGLPSAHVTDLAIAAGGTLWVATAAGVGEGHRAPARDGRPARWSFRAWTPRSGAPLTHLDAVAVLPDGGVAFGALHGLLLRGQDGIFSVLRPGAGLPDGWITAIAAAADGTVVLGTYDAGLLRIAHDRIGHDPIERLAVGIGTAVARINPRALLVSGGRVLAGTSGGGLLVVSPRGTRSFGVRDGLPSAEVTALVADGESLWVGTRSGLVRVRLASAPKSLASSPSTPPIEVARR